MLGYIFIPIISIHNCLSLCFSQHAIDVSSMENCDLYMQWVLNMRINEYFQQLYKHLGLFQTILLWGCTVLFQIICNDSYYAWVHYLCNVISSVWVHNSCICRVFHEVTVMNISIHYFIILGSKILVCFNVFILQFQIIFGTSFSQWAFN